MIVKFQFLTMAINLFVMVSGQDEPGAKWMPSKHYNLGRNGSIAQYLIIHGTGGRRSAEKVGKWFQNPASQVATHYVVGQDGTVVQCVSEANAAWGNGVIEQGADTWWVHRDPNYLTISIEHVKSNSKNSNEITSAQQTASFNLIKNIILRNPGIRKAWADSNGGITGHYSISPITRNFCPGPFPWAQLYQFLNGEKIEKTPCYGIVTSDFIYIRREPNTLSPIVGTLQKGRYRFRAKRTLESIDGNCDWLFYQNGYVLAYNVVLQKPKPSWCNVNLCKLIMLNNNE